MIEAHRQQLDGSIARGAMLARERRQFYLVVFDQDMGFTPVSESVYQGYYAPAPVYAEIGPDGELITGGSG